MTEYLLNKNAKCKRSAATRLYERVARVMSNSDSSNDSYQGLSDENPQSIGYQATLESMDTCAISDSRSVAAPGNASVRSQNGSAASISRSLPNENELTKIVPFLEYETRTEQVELDVEPEPWSDKEALVAPRTVGIVALACIAYVTVCAGPYGIEDAVSAAGTLPVVIAVLALGVLWGMPQSLMTAELSTMIDANGGYVLWVERGMGPFWAWISSYNSFASNTCDLPLYTLLFADYLAQGLPHEPTMWELALLRIACLCFMVILNLRGVESVSKVAVVFTMVVLTPFFLQAIIAPAEHQVDTTVWTHKASTINWSLFMSTLLWNMQGWDTLGSIAGEVKNGQRTYPLGVSLAMLLMTLTYTIPVLIGTGVDGDFSKWSEGHLSVVAGKVAPWLGVWAIVGAAVSQVGNGLTMMASSSRVVWQMAHRHMMPKSLGHSWDKFRTPASAIIFQGLTTAGLMWLPGGFKTLVVFDTFFNNISLLLEGISFLRLRYIEPETHRPYKVPGGMVLAWLITISKVGVVMFALVMSAKDNVYIGSIAVAGNVLFAASYFIVARHLRQKMQEEAPIDKIMENTMLLLSD